MGPGLGRMSSAGLFLHSKHMSNNWHTVWNKKSVLDAKPSVLENLIAADGFDIFGGIEQSGWLNHVRRIGARLGITEGASLYEVGCGAGAFLYPFHAAGHPVGGSDFSSSLVTSAREAMPGADIDAREAAEIDPQTRYDVVLAHGVFLYFPTLEYAAVTLRKMLEKATVSVGVFDVPDVTKKDYALELRRGHLGEEEYNRKYEGLDHLYYPREWFHETLAGTGASVEIEDQQIPGYLHNSYRYNVYIHKQAPVVS